MAVYKSKFKNGSFKAIKGVKTGKQLEVYLEKKIKEARKRRLAKGVKTKFGGVIPEWESLSIKKGTKKKV